MPVLYRKYRPQSFAEVVGQQAIIQTLKNQVALGQIAHAYLFTGSRGVGKTSVARIFAKAVNCQKREQSAKGSEKLDVCNNCEICKQIQEGNFLDLIEIDAASNTGVDNIRDLIEHLKFAPSLGKFKVFIIDEVHMLSKGAFNALLKTLEEPPNHAIFILATTEINKVPTTIISRTQRFDFKALSSKEAFNHLRQIQKIENFNLSEEVLSLVAEHSQGSMRDALSILDKVLNLGGDTTIDEYRKLLGISDIEALEKLMELIVNKKASELPDFFDSLSEKGQDFVVFAKDFLEYLRKILIFKISEKTDSEVDREYKIIFFAKSIKEQEIIFFIRLFLKAYKDIGFAPSQELPLLLASVESAMKDSVLPTQVLKKNEIEHTTETVVDIQTLRSIPKVNLQHTTAETVIASFKPTDNVSFSEIFENWEKITSELKQINGPLANLLKTSPPIEINNAGVVVLGVKFLFHKQNLENHKNMNLLKNAVEKILFKNLSFTVKIIKENQNTPETQNPAQVVADALTIFGGELVE